MVSAEWPCWKAITTESRDTPSGTTRSAPWESSSMYLFDEIMRSSEPRFADAQADPKVILPHRDNAWYQGSCPGACTSRVTVSPRWRRWGMLARLEPGRNLALTKQEGDGSREGVSTERFVITRKPSQLVALRTGWLCHVRLLASPAGYGQTPTGRVAGRYCYLPAPSELDVRVAPHPAQAFTNAPCGTRSLLSVFL